jgi:hypothetical protein
MHLGFHVSWVLDAENTVSVNSLIQFPLHNIRLIDSQQKQVHHWKEQEILVKKQHGYFRFSFICMRFLLLKTLGLGIHSNRYAYMQAARAYKQTLTYSFVD